MASWVNRIGFRGRLVTAMVALVALVSLLIGALLMVYLFDDEKRRAQEQLSIAERVTNEVIARRTDLELSRLSIVVRDFGFRSAIASRDPATLNSALENHSGRVGADFAMLLDSQGELLASTLSRALPGTTAAQLANARNNGADRSLLTIDQRGYEVLVVPVEAPGLRAWLVAGFEMDEALANIIARLSGSSVIFRTSANTPGGFISFAASSDIESGSEPASMKSVGGQNFIESARYFTRTLNLDASGQSAFEAVLMTSREASLQNYYSRALEIGLLVTVIMVFAIVLALLTARYLGRPVLQLARYAKAVGRGDNPQAPDIRTGGELHELRNALRDTLARLIRREAEIRHAATHDEVTGLGNRHALMHMAKEGFDADVSCSLIGLRVSDLSNINDTLGIEFGDKVLRGLSQRLRDELPDASLIARTGGGEFLALVPVHSPGTLKQRALALHNAVESPLDVGNTPFSLRANLITLQLPADASQTNELRRRVNLTFEQALQQGAAVTRYEPGQDENHLRELKLVSDLHSAIHHGGLHMNYQPKLDNHTGQLLQVEALVRWIHPELGFISPEEFIFLAEQSGQINDLTDHILQRVANDARAWFSAGLDVGVAINLSAMDLTWPALTERITSIFAGWHHSMERITLEVTESALMEDPVEAMATLNRLRDLGVTLSVDDFGTGYSSLSQLRKLPVQELKIDKSFVLRLNAEPQDQLIVKSTIDMAHGLGLTVVAEGIENLETWKLLQSWGCNVGQGFYLSRPVSAGDLAQTAATIAERQHELADTTPEHSS
ncbi:MAG: EAL domain-containing protein [Marinobacter sp.]|uniref:putative bifunctional diguanylate cyclase/phosphodiesterase n=1 Tax=Marinobacter sp. TaxID=50741 RepID=UPI001B6828B2|nr:EAL domain-containing protein [Marinobacter sp.]MBQ0815181.1 EAL domain-containing protein [Marinobacter sp.]|tara:strand:- start:2235 stop:4592 length:2358 start_codon:yes stop_codon:yes gene_type:complete